MKGEAVLYTIIFNGSWWTLIDRNHFHQGDCPVERRQTVQEIIALLPEENR